MEGYYSHGSGPYLDFHECSNNSAHVNFNDGAPARRLGSRKTEQNGTERDGTTHSDAGCGVTDAHVFTHKQAKADTCITKEQCQQVSALAFAPGAPAHDCRPATGS